MKLRVSKEIGELLSNYFQKEREDAALNEKQEIGPDYRLPPLAAH